MIKLKYITALLLSGTLLLPSCTKNFDNINSNETAFPDGLQDYDYQKQLIPFKSIQKAIIYQTGIQGTNWQYQIMQNLVADMYSGYFHDQVGSFNNQNSAYALNTGWCAAQWNYTYAQGMPVIITAEDICKEDTFPEFYAISKILKVAMMHRVTDYYGPIMYNTFGTPNVTAESQKDVYNAFFADLDKAVLLIKKHIADKNVQNFEKVDIMMPEGKRTYSQWLKFANSLRLRLAMRVSLVDQALASAEVKKALDSSNGGVLEAADETVGQYGVSNPLGGVSTWDEVFMNANMESFLTGYEDPRLSKYYQLAPGGGDIEYVLNIENTYKGIRQGHAVIEDNRYGSHSKTTIKPATPIVLMSAAEIWFLRAEAALRGFTGEDVKTCYETGIKTSFSQWSAGSAVDYLASENTPNEYKDAYDTKLNTSATTNITPKWMDGNFEQKLEQIITQKWIALYPEGCEAWAEQRRTGYPKLFKVANNLSQGTISTEKMIRRVPFPQDLISSQSSFYNALLSSLGGADNGGTQLWWDVKGGN